MASDLGTETWAVVVVHGVGDAQPGATLGAFVPALIDLSKGELAPDGSPGVVMLPEVVMPDNDRTPQPASDEDRIKGPFFPMHFRRLAVRKPRKDSPHHALFAEVYWADLSKTGDSLWHLLLQLFTVIFHLRYVSDTAAADPNPNQLLTPTFRFFLWCASMLLCGPIAALQVFLLYFLAAVYGAGAISSVFEDVRNYTWFSWVWKNFATVLGQIGLLLLIVFAGIGLSRLWLAARRQNRASHITKDEPKKRLLRRIGILFCSSALLFALVLAALNIGAAPNRGAIGWLSSVAILVSACLVYVCLRHEKTWGGTWFFLATSSAIVAALVTATALSLSVSGVDLEDHIVKWLELQKISGADALVVYQTILSECSRRLSFILCVFTTVAFLVWLIIGAKVLLTGQSFPSGLNAALAALLVQIGLWSLIVPILGMVVVLKLPSSSITDAANFASTVTFHLLLAGIIGISVLVIWGWRKCWTFSARSDGAIPRLLVHSLILSSLVLASFVGFFDFALRFFGRGLEFMSWIGEYNFVVTGSVSGLGVIIFLFRKGMRDALHILTDVINHFYRPRLVPWGHFDLNKMTIQVKIEGRFYRVIEQIFAMAKVTRLTVVAHSQGTVIAIGKLWQKDTAQLIESQLERNNQADKDWSEKTPQLVTMGSPFTHLYQHYFPDRYSPLYVKNSNGGLVFYDSTKNGWGPYFEKMFWKRWINIYRKDDFVGTEITGKAEFPENQPVAPGGHTDYWRQAEVLQVMWDYLPGAKHKP